MSQEPTNKEIMGAINKLQKNVESVGKNIISMETRMETLDRRTGTVENAIVELHEAVSAFASNVDERFEKVDHRFEKMESRMDSMESKMVTKDYLDEKLFDLRGDIFTVIRKEDRKLEFLIEILCSKKVLTKKDKENILELELFPKSI